ncbi:potassium channel family protein [Haladaptatus sp. CMAA 1911]|uniref:potassium channel family protein n=1 Tax=unclassified Haladaptatus TaxID=2622732 RepID=UPI003754FFD5
MVRQRQRVRYYLLALLCAVLVFTVAYNFGMRAFEGRPQPFLHSLVMVFETFTTTGYGEDAPWTSPIMNLLVLGMQISGVVLLLAALPVFIIPLIENRLAMTPPTALDGVADHVIVCGDTQIGRSLVSEFVPREVEYVILESDRDSATELYEANYSVLHGDPESPETFHNANVADATAVITDAPDEIGASIVLAARESDDDVHVVSIVDDGELGEYQRYAGANQVLSPRHLLGKSLANRARSVSSENLSDIIDLHESFEIAELPLTRDSDFVGRTLADNRLGERTGVGVIGAWQRGAFVSPLPADAVLDEHTRLLVVGRPAQLERLEDVAQSAVRQQRREPIVLIGSGEVADTVAEQLGAADVPIKTLNKADGPNVDVVGSPIDPTALRSVGIEEANTVVIALPNDTKALYTALVVRNLNPNVEIIVGANDSDNVRKLYRAGADSVLALTRISGQLVASDVLHEDAFRRSVSPVEVVRTSTPGLAGRTLADSRVRTATGATILAVQRDGEVITGIDPSFTPERDDEFIVLGTGMAIESFEEL